MSLQRGKKTTCIVDWKSDRRTNRSRRAVSWGLRSHPRQPPPSFSRASSQSLAALLRRRILGAKRKQGGRVVGKKWWERGLRCWQAQSAQGHRRSRACFSLSATTRACARDARRRPGVEGGSVPPLFQCDVVRRFIRINWFFLFSSFFIHITYILYLHVRRLLRTSLRMKG